MENHWKLSNTDKKIFIKPLRDSTSPARFIQPSSFKRDHIIKSKRPLVKTEIKATTSESSLKIQSNNSTFIKLQPKKRSTLEIFNSTPDLKSSKIKEAHLARQQLGYQKIENYNERVKKEYEILTQQDIAKLRLEKEDLAALEIKEKPAHRYAKIFFKSVKNNEERRVLELLKTYPELLKESDCTGQSALHWAVKRGNLNIIQLLINLGANIVAKDMVGRRPEDIAKNKKLEDIYYFLVFARRKSIQMSKIYMNSNEIIEELNAFMKNRELNKKY